MTQRLESLSPADREEARDVLRKRYAPLAEARQQWRSATRVKQAVEALRRVESPEQAASALKELVVAVELVEKGSVFDSLARDLLPATREAIQMVRARVSVEEVGAHLRVWTESDFGHEVEEDFYRLGTLVEDRLRVDEQLSRAMFRTADAAPPGPLQAPAVPGGAPTEQHEIEVDWVKDDLAVVTKGPYRTEVNGESRVKLFHLVWGHPGQDQTWQEIQRAWLGEDGQLGPQGEGLKPPPMQSTLQRCGRRIRTDLRELGCYWHQDATGVRWAPSPTG